MKSGLKLIANISFKLNIKFTLLFKMDKQFIKEKIEI